MHARLPRVTLPWLVLALLIAPVTDSLAGRSAAAHVAARGDMSRDWYRAVALRAQRYTWRTLAYYGAANDCASAPSVSYARDSNNVTISDHWYVALQVMADAALVRLGEREYVCNVERAVVWMEMLWDPGHAGFAPRADLDGSNPTLRDIYADDNALIGLAFLEAARVVDSPAVRSRAVFNAERAAAYLLNSGLWDYRFGGGLWWNNQRSLTGEGKPAQTTALLAHLTAELYAATGKMHYHDWAAVSIAWLNAALWDDNQGLYLYSINHPPGDPDGVELDDRYFGYDQAIVIQALLRMYHVHPDRVDYLTRAQRIGRALDRAFWHPELGGYTLQAGVTDLYAPYGVWISEALLDLYAADGDPFWRARARANFDALHRVFSTREAGRYARMAFPCEGERLALCQYGERYGRDVVVYTMTQALMQRNAALLAAAH